MVYGHAVTINATGLILQAQWVPKHNAALIRMYDYIAQPAAFIRRSAIEGCSSMSHTTTSWMRSCGLGWPMHGDFRRIDRILAIDRHHLERKSAAGARPAANETARLSRQYGVRIEGQNSLSPAASTAHLSRSCGSTAPSGTNRCGALQPSRRLSIPNPASSTLPATARHAQ